MTEIFTAKSVEEAKKKAASKFGKKISEIRFEVIEEGKKGILGIIGQQDAKVKATYEPVKPAAVTKSPVIREFKAETEPEKVQEVVENTDPVKEAQTMTGAELMKKVGIYRGSDEVSEKTEKTDTEKTIELPSEEIKAAVESVEAVQAEGVEVVNESAEEETKTEEVKAEPAEEEAKAEEIKAEKTESAKVNTKDDEEIFSLDNFTLIEDPSQISEKVKIATDYMTTIFRAMGIDASYTVYQNETGAVIDVDSDNNGAVIGRRGETLDSLQYLCSIIANKGDKEYYRITINCLGYRQKRRETLEQLAAKVAKSVLKTGRSQPLEPMNPYERRVIHSAVASIEGVSSRSVGEEPYRKIIISSNNPKPQQKRGRGGKRDDRNGNRRNSSGRRGGGRERAPQQPLERKKIDLATSFEKDYKKPKPEDSMEGGLYGKIEL